VADPEVTSNSLKRKHDTSVEEPKPAKMPPPQPFQFTKQGDWVAVFYSAPVQGPTYHIGQILDIVDQNSGHVTYLESCILKKNLFRFGCLDVDLIESKYVFHHGFNLTTANGRTWTLANENRKEIKQYVGMYY
jgi:hypothetical protein